MIDPVVRVADAGDRDQLIWLEELARAALSAQRGGELWLERHQEQSPEWASAAAGNVLVATIDEVVVGYLRHERIDTVFHVRDVFVHPDAREVGFGDALLDAAIAVGRRDGARRIEAEALPGDRDTKNLYERAGITAKRITVSSALDELDAR